MLSHNNEVHEADSRADLEARQATIVSVDRASQTTATGNGPGLETPPYDVVDCSEVNDESDDVDNRSRVVPLGTVPELAAARSTIATAISVSESLQANARTICHERHTARGERE
jgi:hypothetical protein